MQFKDWSLKHEEFNKLHKEEIKTIRANADILKNKFDFFERVSTEFHLNIEALKTHALTTDLHLESALPI